MATNVLTDAKLWFDGWDLSGDMNALGHDYAAEMLDDTVFGDDTRSNKGGLKTWAFSHEGLWSGGDDNVDDALFQNIGVEDVLMTTAPETGAAGEVAYFGRIATGEYSPAGSVGEMFRFSVSGEASSTPTRGTIIGNATVTSTGAQSAHQVGAVSASEKLYAGIHVVAASGTSPTLDATIESDAADDFTGSESTRVTFSQFTDIGSEWATPVDGAITDDWWRVAYTIGGTDPSFDIIVTIGIQ